MLYEEIAHAVGATDAVIDGEIVCMEPGWRSHFRKPLYRAKWSYLLAFDLLHLEGRDLRSLPLVERKQLLATIMPRVESHVQFVDAVDERGEDFFRVVCEHDLEGVVARPKYGPLLCRRAADQLAKD